MSPCPADGAVGPSLPLTGPGSISRGHSRTRPSRRSGTGRAARGELTGASGPVHTLPDTLNTPVTPSQPVAALRLLLCTLPRPQSPLQTGASVGAAAGRLGLGPHAQWTAPADGWGAGLTRSHECYAGFWFNPQACSQVRRRRHGVWSRAGTQPGHGQHWPVGLWSVDGPTGQQTRCQARNAALCPTVSLSPCTPWTQGLTAQWL